MRKAHFASVLMAASLVGCATIMEGTGQSVQVSTSPSGAACQVSREGAHLGDIASTPGSIRVDKSKNDLTVTCSKPGYQMASVTRSPGFQGTTFGNIILGGGVGAIVDASTGANYEYPGQINLDLAPAAAAALPTVPAQPPASISSAERPVQWSPCGGSRPCNVESVGVSVQ